jgi:predicted lysophospholipase L1 biosynthesis ABC-type transport system permease subunit
VLVPPLLRAVEWLDSPAVDSDAYLMRFVACPCGVALGAIAPAVLDHLFASFLPMLLPESPTQLASTGMSYPMLFAVMLQVAPLAMVAAVAPRVPRDSPTRCASAGWRRRSASASASAAARG